jgi:NADPH2 dehydrogenase
MSKLFSPVRIGNTELKHRVVLAPLTRYRADDAHVPLNFVKDYYAQRASTPGTLLITEGTFISPRAGGFANVPGIYNDSQVKAWREVTEEIHAKGCYIFCQLWALGRAADPKLLKKNGHKLVSSGNIPMSADAPVPQLLTEEGIHAFIQDYANAAKLAIEAGFDGVEIHGANGYLCDQFLQDNCNNRTDGWGGSVEKRSRFCLEVAKAVAAAVGGERAGYRMSPWSPFQGMKMENPRPQFTHLAQNLKELGLAYIHVVESRISGAETIDARAEQADFLVDVWGDAGTVILAGGFTPESAKETVKKYEEKQVVIAFGRNFLANPDLPFRISQGISLTKYNRSTFYIPESPVGYIDYPFSEEYLGRKTAVY